MRRYPHQLSGGMQQRVVIAMALAKDPTLLILDEPTTGLDATVEAEVLDLVSALRSEFGTTVLFISHNLDVITKMCDRVGVLYAGRLVEEGPVAGGLRRPAPPLHGRPAALPAARRRAQGPAAARHHPGLPAAARRRPARLRLRRPLRARAGHLPQGGAAVPRPRATAATAAATSTSRRTSCRARRRRRRPCSAVDHDAEPVDPRARTCARPSARRATTSARSTTSRSSCGRARRSASSASRAAARRRSPGRCSASLRADEGGGHRARRRGARRARSRKRDARRGARAADRLPEPRLGAQPALLGAAASSSRALEKLRGAPGDEREEHLRELARFGALRRAPSRLAPGAALGRAQAARRDRARVRRRPARRRLRRADVGARRLGAGGDPQPARRPAADKGVSYLFISHDLGVVRYLSDRIAVLYLGRVMELGAAETVFDGAAPSVHGGAAVVGAARSTARSGRGSGSRARSPARRPAVGLRVPHALPALHRRHLRRRGAAAARGRARHLWRCHHPIEELRELQTAAAATHARRRRAADAADGLIRAAVLERPGRRSRSSSWTSPRRGPARCSSACARAESATRT